jgi:hypothetical protein
LEIGSGSGLNSKIMKQYGIKVISTEIQHSQPLYTDIIKLSGITSVKRYRNHTLFICWPSIASNFAYNSLKQYTGDIFIYIGELMAACANDAFF